MPTAKAEIWDCTNEQYHADTTSIGRSQFGTFIESPELYEWYHVHGHRRKSTEALDFGSLCDDAFLRPGPCGSGVVVIPDDVLSSRGAREGGAWKAFAAANLGKVLVKKDEDIRYMRDKLMANPRVREYLEAPGLWQHTVRWDCAITGLRLRCRTDKLLLDAAGNPALILDYKTSKSAKPRLFASSADEYGYHRQHPWYQDGIEAFYGVRVPFLFIVQQKSPPYTVEVMELAKSFVEMGRAEIARHLPELKQCLLRGEFGPRSKGDIIVVPEPTYAKYKSEWEL